MKATSSTKEFPLGTKRRVGASVRVTLNYNADGVPTSWETRAADIDGALVELPRGLTEAVARLMREEAGGYMGGICLDCLEAIEDGGEVCPGCNPVEHARREREHDDWKERQRADREGERQRVASLEAQVEALTKIASGTTDAAA